MASYTASFEVNSTTDLYAVRRIVTQAYDTIREESRTVRDGLDDQSEVLEEFKGLRDATADASSGTLSITYVTPDD